MSVLIEQYVPVVREHGIVTNKNLLIGASANLDMSGSTGYVKGLSQQVISGQPATVTLTSGQSDALCLFDSAAGIVYTLPVPVPGDSFDFMVTATITSNNAKIITDASTTYIAGGIVTCLDNTANKQWVGNGTSHRAIIQNGSTTGGIIGSYFTVLAVTTSLWVVSGTLIGSGTIVTPFATS